jgi:transposase
VFLVRRSLGASSVFFHCGSCGNRADRDVNAARNIFIKNWQMLL